MIGQNLPDKSWTFFLLIVSLISYGYCSGVSTIKCKDDFGRDVDWFLAYKLPKLKASNDEYVKKGLAYSYILPQALKWKKSEKSVNETDSMIGRTISDLFSPDANIAYVLYNDQPPSGRTIVGNGHTKGILLANPAGGIWLQHSVPHFVGMEKNHLHYSYPFTGLSNGQMLFCFSLTLPQLDSIGRVLEITKPNIYNYSIPESFKSILPTLEQVVKSHTRKGKLGEFPTQITNSIGDNENQGSTNKNAIREERQASKASNDTHEIFQLKTSSRVFTVLAKSPKFLHEVYADWVAPQLQSGLDVQSWLNGPNAYPSNCTSKSTPVYNIEDKNISGYNFSTHNDHSKWAVSIDEKNPWVCVADLNRMEAQSHRGGALICFSDKDIWDTFRASVVDTQPCQRPHNNINPTTESRPSPAETDNNKDAAFHKRIWRKMKSYWTRIWNGSN